MVALEAGGVRLVPVRVTRSGSSWTRRPLAAEHAGQIQDWELAPGGTALVYERSSATLPPQWYAAGLDGAAIAAPRQLTDLNPSWRAKPTGRVETVRWTGALDEEVEGLLHYPLDWPQGGGDGGDAAGAAGRRPLIVHIHGGPAGANRDAWDLDWSDPVVLWRQRGAFVLQANYHGSSDYGLDWVESIEKRYYELEVPDLEAGVDRAIARGLADPERLAAVGWSNGGLEVGRFEVTRAQWAAFDPAATPLPAEADLPATGMSFERAREYAAWLAAATGRPFRLPTEAEAEALASAGEAAEGGGNTLGRWLGAAPNPEDRAAVAAALAAAGGRLGAAPLLLPVGSFPGAGDDPLFDLDGNAAEWAVGENGTGVAAGPSAERADDPRGGEAAGGDPVPDPAYVGLRVVVGGSR